MNDQSPYLGGTMPPNANTNDNHLPAMIKQEIYSSYDDHQQHQHQQSTNILRDAFLMTMSDEAAAGLNAGHHILAAPTPSATAYLINQESMPAPSPVDKLKQRHIYESPEARARRLARNAERMRERRANESEEEYRIRREKMAAANRHRRMMENEIDKAVRHLKDAARQRLRRAMETTEQRAKRLEKLAERSRISRMNETPEQKAERNRKCLESNKLRYQRRQAGLIPKAKSRKEKKRGNAATAAAAAVLAPQPTQLPAQQLTSHNLQEIADKKMPNLLFSEAHLPIPNSPHGSYDQLYSTYPSPFKSSPFPDLPPHIAPNQPKYYGHIQNFAPTQTSQLQYIPTPFNHHQTALQQTNAGPSPATNQQQQQHPINQTHGLHPPSATHQQPLNIYNTQIVYTSGQPQIVEPQPEVTRGRPIKILPSNNYQAVAPALQHEAMRQQKLNHMLEEQINIIMTNPKQSRGRPPSAAGAGPMEESETQREERLRKMREARKAQRDLETPERREMRLKDLSERARKRRVALLTGESEEERRERLRKQADYARERRNRGQTPQAYRQSQEDAKNLYAKLHQ